MELDEFYGGDAARPITGCPPRRDHHVETEVFVLLVEPSRSRLDALLKGWADLQGQPEGFEELVGRLDAAGYPPPW